MNDTNLLINVSINTFQMVVKLHIRLLKNIKKCSVVCCVSEPRRPAGW